MRLKPIALAGGCLLAGLSLGQQQAVSPQLGYAYPAGARQGSTVDVVLGGQRLAGNARVLAGTGITVEVVDYVKPMTQKEVQDTRDKLQAAAQKLGLGATLRPGLRTNPVQLARIANEAGIDEKDLKRYFAFIRERADPKKQPNPQLAETLTLKLKIAPNAPLGLHEIRVVSAMGISNPVRFYVDRFPEYCEIEPNDDEPCPVDKGLPVILNGQIMPGEEDAFSIPLKKGQPFQISAMARAITPYLADAVPGWFQAHLSLKDPDGREVAYADHDGFNQDPSMSHTPAKDGKYTLSIRDAIYRGREDFVYRIYVGPPSSSSKLAFASDGMKEKEPNNAPSQTVMVSLPETISGSIAAPGDADCFRFRGNAGEKVVVEVTARRAGSPLDSSVTVTDSNGKMVAYNDDYDDKAASLITHQADSYAAFTLPATGIYTVTIRDTQAKGGPEYRYRLRVSRAEPDFELRVVPSAITLRPGICTPVTVFALRRDGFDGDINLQLEKAPKGVQLSGGLLPAGADQVRVTISSGFVSTEPFELVLSGSATVGGRAIVRDAVPADDMMQAFAYRHLVPASRWLALTAGRFARASAGFQGPDKPVQVPLGGTARIRLAGPGKMLADSMSFELSNAPVGLSLKSVTGVEGALVIEVRADASLLRAGLKGNLILDMFMQRTNALAKRPNAAKTLVGCLPAISFEIVK